MVERFTELSKGLLANKRLYWMLFLSLFAYAIARAWFVVPMLDELSTFFNYIRTGHYFNTIERVDANNHILNSFVGHQWYRLFGDSFFLFRLSSVLSFPFYFFSLRYLVQKSISKPIGTLVFLSLVCIPWIFEYFSYTRGYGVSIAFFFTAIAFVLKWKSSKGWIDFAAILLCLGISIASNLTYLFPSLVLVVYTQLLFIIEGNFNRRRILINTLLMFGWFATISPFVQYGFKLREANALWWGNQDGLWESTGKSLSKLVLFSGNVGVLYFIVVLMLFCAFYFIKGSIKQGLWSFVQRPEAMFFILFVGCLTGIVVMRYVLDVNYPMDRVAMYIVPLFIVCVSVYLSQQRVLKIALLGLLYFPLSFIYHINLSTSIFSPEDRIPTYLTDQIKEELNDETTLSAEYVSHLSYAYSCREDKKVYLANTVTSEDLNDADFHISWLNTTTVDNYRTITEDPDSKTRFMRRKNRIERNLVIDTLINNVANSDGYFTLLKRPIDRVLLNKKIQVQISGELEFDRPTLAFNFIQTTANDKNQRLSAISPRFNWYFSDRTDINFSFTNPVVQLSPDENHFHYFWVNRDFIHVKVKFIRVRVYEII